MKQCMVCGIVSCVIALCIAIVLLLTQPLQPQCQASLNQTVCGANCCTNAQFCCGGCGACAGPGRPCPGVCHETFTPAKAVSSIAMILIVGSLAIIAWIIRLWCRNQPQMIAIGQPVASYQTIP